MQMEILLGWIPHKYLQVFSKCPETFHTCIGQSGQWNQLAHVVPVGGQCLIWEGSPKTRLTGPDVCSCMVAAGATEMSHASWGRRFLLSSDRHLRWMCQLSCPITVSTSLWREITKTMKTGEVEGWNLLSRCLKWVEMNSTVSPDTLGNSCIVKPAPPVLLVHPDLQSISTALTLTTLSVQYFLQTLNCLKKA